MPCLASFFDVMSGVKNPANSIPMIITCPTSAKEPSFMGGTPKLCDHLPVQHDECSSTLRQKTMLNIALGLPCTNQSVSCLAPCFDTMSGVKQLVLNHAIIIIDCTSYSCQPSASVLKLAG